MVLPAFRSGYITLALETIYSNLPEKLGLLLLPRQLGVASGLVPKVIFI